MFSHNGRVASFGLRPITTLLCSWLRLNIEPGSNLWTRIWAKEAMLTKEKGTEVLRMYLAVFRERWFLLTVELRNQDGWDDGIWCLSRASLRLLKRLGGFTFVFHRVHGRSLDQLVVSERARLRKCEKIAAMYFLLSLDAHVQCWSDCNTAWSHLWHQGPPYGAI